MIPENYTNADLNKEIETIVSPLQPSQILERDWETKRRQELKNALETVANLYGVSTDDLLLRVMMNEIQTNIAKEPRPLEHVEPVAASLVEHLAPHCDRLEIAGSIRRKAATVGDIEIVAIPKREPDLFGEPTGEDTIEAALSSFPGFERFHKNGERYKQVLIKTEKRDGEKFRRDLHQVDLFLCDRETWGLCFLIRTGPANFSRKLVDRDTPGALIPRQYQIKNLHLFKAGLKLETPEEADVFKIFNIPFIKPEDRR